jgi:formylglycine-generating enzyme required for sulfatase activity
MSTNKEGEDWKTVRGGSFYDGRQYLRAAIRLDFHPGDRNRNFGFRCAQDP